MSDRWVRIVFGSRLCALAFNFMIGVIIARSLGPDGKGVYAFIMIFPELANSVGGLGFHEAVTYHSAAGYYKPGDIGGTSIIVAFFVGTLYIFLFSVLFLFHYIPVPKTHVSTVLIALLSIPFARTTNFLSNMLRGQNDLAGYAFPIVFHSSIYLLSTFLILSIFGQGIEELLPAFVVATIITSIIVTRRVKKSVESMNFNPIFLKVGCTFGLKTWIGTISAVASRRVDFLILPLLTSTYALGQYSVATQLAESALILPASIAAVLMPRITKSHEDGFGLTSKWLRRQAIFTLAFSILVFLVGQPLIVFVFGERFRSSYFLLLYLLPGILSLSLSTILSSHFSGIGRPLVNSSAAFFGLAVGLVFYLTLIPAYGAVGASIGSSISYSCQFAVQYFIFIAQRRSFLEKLSVAFGNNMQKE